VSERAKEQMIGRGVGVRDNQHCIGSAGAEIEQHSWDHMCCNIPSSSSCTTGLVPAKVLSNWATKQWSYVPPATLRHDSGR
jgi:hypothetical protein